MFICAFFYASCNTFWLLLQYITALCSTQHPPPSPWLWRCWPRSPWYQSWQSVVWRGCRQTVHCAFSGETCPHWGHHEHLGEGGAQATRAAAPPWALGGGHPCCEESWSVLPAKVRRVSLPSCGYSTTSAMWFLFLFIGDYTWITCTE